MRRRIDLLDEQYNVTVTGRPEAWLLQVDDGEPQPVALTTAKDGAGAIKLGGRSDRMKIVVKGEMVYIRAFDRTFTLQIVDPVDQAAQESGGSSNTARAPMPGIVVEIVVTAGDRICKGQPMMTIESMKMLTVITAPRDGEVARIHYEPGDSFDKNAALVSLKEEKEKQHAPH